MVLPTAACRPKNRENTLDLELWFMVHTVGTREVLALTAMVKQQKLNHEASVSGYCRGCYECSDAYRLRLAAQVVLP